MPAKYDFFAMLEDKTASSLERMQRAGELDLYSYLVLMHGNDARRGGDTSTGLAKVAHGTAVHQRNGVNRFTRELVNHGLLRELGLIGVDESGLGLPDWAVAVQFDFRLAKNFLSRDDSAFYPIDNPVRKEKVFKIPMMAGSSWKGNLRSSAVDELLGLTGRDQAIERRLKLAALFGDEKGSDDEEGAHKNLRAFLDRFLGEKFGAGAVQEFESKYREQFGDAEDEREEGRHKGRIRCLSTFFDAIETDVINPRSRKTRAGTLPIPMEVVPPGARGRFTAIYFPFDLLGEEHQTILSEEQGDWELLGRALYRMFRISGFGAKKSSGCGKAEEPISGFLLRKTGTGIVKAGLAGMSALTTIGGAFEGQA